MKMLTNEKLNRRNYLKGLSLGAGGVLFAPLLQKVAAAADGSSEALPASAKLLISNYEQIKLLFVGGLYAACDVFSGNSARLS